MPAPCPPCWTGSSDRYRYVVVFIGFVTLAGASGVSSIFGVFYKQLLSVFDWSHAGGASVYSVNMLVVAASSPAMGWALDRFGPRRLYPLAAVLIGAALIACSRLHSLGHYILFYGVFSALGQTALLSMTVVVARWFAHAQRGRAIGIADVGTGFGMVAFAPGSALLITQFGWRPAFLVLGLVLIVVLVPLNLLHRPAPAVGKSGSHMVSLKGVLRSRELWTLCAAHLFMTITMTMVNVHLVEFLVSAQVVPFLRASMLVGSLSLVSLPGRVFFGWLVDRLQPNGAFTVAMSCTITGFLLLVVLAQFEASWSLGGFVCVYGFAQGAGGIAVAAKTVAFFQGPYLGRIFMVVSLSANLGAAFGAWFGGWLFDLSGRYVFTFLTAMISGACAIGCMWAGGTVRRSATR